MLIFRVTVLYNLQKISANKDYHENNSYNNFTNNSDNEKLNNSKSEINYRDNVQINNKVLTMSNRVSQNPVTGQVRTITEMKTTTLIITMIMKITILIITMIMKM